jgi:enamine deaminase RidA (YjgF/YER057c/UK114 family)
MSQALASARKRRAPAPVNPLPTPTQQTNSISGSPNSGLTLPQVISLVDRRLINLENFMNETRNNGVLSQNTNVNTSATVVSNASSAAATETGKYEELTEDLTNIVEEVNSRFELLAGEILEMKNIVLKLQSFTMEVNKTLLEERNFIMSSKEDIVLDDGSTDEKNLTIENEKTQSDEEKDVVSDLPVFEISNPNNFSVSADL